MNRSILVLLAAAATVLFLVLNFTVDDAGTIFLILAVLAGLLTAYLIITRSRGGNHPST
jgi:hypothetical protein